MALHEGQTFLSGRPRRRSLADLADRLRGRLSMGDQGRLRERVAHVSALLHIARSGSEGRIPRGIPIGARADINHAIRTICWETSMALTDEFRDQGEWLFRWRSYLPL